MKAAILALACLPIALLAQQRDAAVALGLSGTATIRGVVMGADGQTPMRRAIVTVTGAELPAPRSAITDDRGGFAIGRLPAGTFTVVAKKAAFLQAEFGATKPGRPGSRVAVSSSETRSITMTMFRGAAIGGVLRNVNGTPVVGVAVHVVNVRSTEQIDIGLAEPAITSDRGEYRIYGLMPGEYLVVAAPVAGGTGEIGLRSAREMDALLATLRQRDGRSGATAATPRPSLPPQPPSVGYAPTYFPGTAIFSEAERIGVAAGDDRSNVSFVVTRVPVAAIEGTVSGNVPNLAAAQLTIIPDGWRTFIVMPGSVPFTAIPPNEKGEFKFGNLAPGRYRIVARVMGVPEAPPAPGARGAAGGARIGGAGAAPASGVKETLFGVADVDVRGQDVKGVDVPLQPGGLITGKIVFDADAAAARPDPGRIRLALNETGRNGYYNLGTLRVGNGLSQVQPAGPGADGTFRIAGIGPAVYDLSITLPPDAARTWQIRSAVADGRDLLDSGITGPFVNLRDVTVTLSDRRTEINGFLLSGSNQPVNDYFVVAFSTDRANWKAGARRNAVARPATNGRFVFSDLPAGEYFIAALDDLDPAEWQSAAFLAQVAPAAIRITIAEGEKKTQDLRLR